MSSTNTAIFTLPQGTIVMNTVYAFTVVVRSKDRRSNSRTVIVSPTNSTAQLSITSSISRFNPSAKLVLDATISANYAVDFTWSVLTVLGAPLDIPSLTNKLISFPGSTELSAISFPLSVIGGSFTPGKAYTFQLSVSSIEDAANTIYSQITLTANSAPTSGRIVSSPTNGSALVTQFIVSSPGWTTDAASFPLSYAFSYRMFSASANLTIAVSSVRPYTTTLLPSGEIILLTQVTDIYFTSAVATTNVAVTSAPALNFVSHILNVSLATAFAAGNINLAIQTVNNVSIPALSKTDVIGRKLMKYLISHFIEPFMSHQDATLKY